LMKHLRPRPHETILETGCGNGRLTEFVAPHARRVIGTDLIDAFIDACRRPPDKAPNTEYHYLRDLAAVDLGGVEKAFTLGVWMYLGEEDALVGALRSYLELLPGLEELVFIEQVKDPARIETVDGSFYCIYRSIGDYTRLFERAGCEVRQIVLAGERKFAPLAKRLFERPESGLYRSLPRSLYRLAPLLFHLDHGFKRVGLAPIPAATAKPIDVVFRLTPRR